jgi:SAM-dependent methyltransferase
VWEQAEIKRSSSEAARTAANVRPTSPAILKRYATPPASTIYALEYAYHLAGDVRGRHVLDLGCGSGQNASILASRGAQVSAMDISPDLLDLTARRAQLDGLSPRITPVEGSTHQIPLPDSSVDLVFGNAILHHVDLDLTAREVHRVLKPGGHAVFKEPLRNSRLIAFVRNLIPYRQPDVSPFERPLRLDEIQRFASPFARWHRREFELPVVAVARLLRLSPDLQTRIREWDRRVLDRLPFLRRFATVIVFEVVK